MDDTSSINWNSTTDKDKSLVWLSWKLSFMSVRSAGKISKRFKRESQEFDHRFLIENSFSSPAPSHRFHGSFRVWNIWNFIWFQLSSVVNLREMALMYFIFLSVISVIIHKFSYWSTTSGIDIQLPVLIYNFRYWSATSCVDLHLSVLIYNFGYRLQLPVIMIRKPVGELPH